MSEVVFSVRVGLYFTVVPNTRKRVSGSTITGAMDATLYCCRLVMIEFFVVVVSELPLFGLIEI
jgi:hypothetical protein